MSLESVSLEALAGEQRSLAGKVVLSDGFGDVRTIAGVDQAFFGDSVISALVVCSAGTLEPVAKAHCVMKADFPYIPGFLSFREAPSILGAWKSLRAKPDVLMVDGQGIAHPRGIGLASHVGVVLGVPTVGVAKSRLFGEFTPPSAVGMAERLAAKGSGKQIGWVLKTKPGCRPLFISPGHKVSIGSSLSLVSRCLLKHKLPEPVRLAHNHAAEVKRSLVV
jgi:deoxyribonuclease V